MVTIVNWHQLFCIYVDIWTTEHNMLYMSQKYRSLKYFMVHALSARFVANQYFSLWMKFHVLISCVQYAQAHMFPSFLFSQIFLWQSTDIKKKLDPVGLAAIKTVFTLRKLLTIILKWRQGTNRQTRCFIMCYEQ